MFQAMSQKAFIVSQAITDAELKMPKNLDKASRKKLIQENINKFIESNLVSIEGAEGTGIGRFDNIDVKVDSNGKPVTALGAAAQEYAQRMTFNQKMNKGSLGDTLVRAVEKHPALRLILPFPRVTTNITAAIAQHLPLVSLATSDFRRAVAAGGQEAIEAWSKVAVGTAVSAGIYGLALDGFVTGSGPRNPSEREMWLAAGNKPNSFHVGDLWIPYDNMEPWATLLSTAADTADYAIRMENSGETGWESNLDVLTWGYSAGLLKALADKSLMAGILDFAQVTADPRRFMQTYLQNTALSMNPQFITMTRNIIDPYFREQRTFLDSLRNRVPGLSETLPTQRSWLDGAPKERNGGWMSAVSPLYVETKEQTASMKLADELMGYKGLRLNPGKIVNGNELTGEQESRYHELHGTLRLNGKTQVEALNALMASKKFQKYKEDKGADETENRATAELNKVILKYRAEAKRQLAKEYPELGNPKPRTAVSNWSQSVTKTKQQAATGTKAVSAITQF
jgi:hypothetical protein